MSKHPNMLKLSDLTKYSSQIEQSPTSNQLHLVAAEHCHQLCAAPWRCFTEIIENSSNQIKLKTTSKCKLLLKSTKTLFLTES